MTSVLSSRNACDQRQVLPEANVDRPEPAPTAARSSFAREKFLWLDQVRADPELTPLAFMLAYVIAGLVNEDKGYAWPSVARLAAECRVTEAGVKKVIRRLVEREHLRVEFGVGRGKTNRYRWILKDAVSANADPQGDGQNAVPCDQGGRARLSPRRQKGATPVAPIQSERGNCGFEKGQLPFQKGVTPVTPISIKDSKEDPFYRFPPPQRAQTAPAGFDDFWRAYPKKVARADAMRAYVLALQHAPVEDVLRGAMRYANERGSEDPRFTKHPATWLRKACWRDPPKPRDRQPEPTRGGWLNRSTSLSGLSNEDFDDVLSRIQHQRQRR